MPFTGFSKVNTFYNAIEIKSNIDINITINSSTTDKELEEIAAMLAEHNIAINFSKIKRNSDNLITSIKIKVEDNNGTSMVSQQSGNASIEDIHFGRKDNKLYLNSGSNFPNSNYSLKALKNNAVINSIFSQLDSLAGFMEFDFMDMDAFKSFDKQSIDSIKQKFKSFDNDLFTLKGDINASKYTQFKFIDDPKKDTYIIIDGKESDFKTLDKLSKSKQLESVDILKGKVAISLYGEKAKDGAIIAVTKK